LAQGDLAAASRWDDSLKHAFDSDDASGSEHELIQIGRARVWIALKRSDAAVALLSSLEARARSAGRIGRVIEILVLKALAVQEMGDSDRAYAALAASLTLAEPEGYVRVFLDEGEPMKMLLAQWLARAEVGEPKSDDLRTYASRLLAHFDTEPGAGLAERDARSPVRPVHEPTSLVEPLTERELEILHLIAVGSTNKEIAKQLFIAVGTVKAHTSSIYGKLGVANRTEAVAHARQLGILP
jgi:LuxR family maltose regulon positive regulatory protein